MDAKLKLYMAPLQGFTEAEYRHAHCATYGNVCAELYTPFLRVDKGEVWARGLRDALSPLNSPQGVVPQIIVGSINEFDLLSTTLKARQFKRIDINLGCPFPPQVKRGRGAGTLLNTPLLHLLSQRIAADTQCSYSVKMRLGVDAPNQWIEPLTILNDTPLTHITLHPRIASDQYRGEVRRDMFAAFASHCRHPLIYNGDILTPADIASLPALLPSIAGIMAGRGLLSRPSLFAEYTQGREWLATDRLAHLHRLYCAYRANFGNRLQGDRQLLAKLKPFWEYLEPEIGRKAWKTLHKTTTLRAYDQAIAAIFK